MKNEQELKELVKEKYSIIVNQSEKEGTSSCCGGERESGGESACGCSEVKVSALAEEYTKLPGYAAEADLGLGCGLPTKFAKIKSGDTVVDLGSGAGNDCFVARSIVGEKGRVIGLDMTEAMVDKAKANAQKLGFSNVEFRLGDIENMPMEDNTADVVVSNCVLNLVPNKQKAFSETYRILKHGGHFSISDVVLQGELPDELRAQEEMYAGCIAGAIQKEEYLRKIKEAGFVNLTLQKESSIDIPDDTLKRFLTPEQVREFKKNRIGIYSITVYGEKP
jgi:ubiquinone/menaquinone biosynthesis C-methylase UbiE